MPGNTNKTVAKYLSNPAVALFFKELLEEQTNDIIQKLQEDKSALSKQEVESLTARNDLLSGKLSMLEEQLKAKDRLLAEYKEELTATQMLADKAGHFEADLAIYSERYGTLDTAYDAYTTLSAETKSRLRNVFQTDNIFAFLAGGLRTENIEGLRDLIRYKIVEADHTDLDKLTHIFLFMLHAFNESTVTPTYTLITPDAGEKYNSDYHLILGDSVDGTVKAVRLPGFINNKTQKITKALIEV